MAENHICLAGKKSLYEGLHMQELFHARLFNPILLKDKGRKINIKTDEVLPEYYIGGI